MVGPDMQAVRNFFQIDNSIVFPRGGLNLGVAQGDFIYLDADQAVPNDTISYDGTAIRFKLATLNKFSVFNNLVHAHSNLTSSGDNLHDCGVAAARWRNIFAATQMGIHSGAGFTTSLQSGAITVASKPGLTWFAAEELRLGDGVALAIPTMPTLATEANITTPVDGMFYYNSTLNRIRAREAGAWVNLV